MKIRWFYVVALLLAYLCFHLHPSALAQGAAKATPSKASPTGKKNASQLLEAAEQSLAFTVKSARAAGTELSPKNPSAKPFLQSLQTIGKSLDTAKKSLAAKDQKFFKALSDAQAGVQEMQIAWDLTKSKNPQVIKGAKGLGGAVAALHNQYGPMAQRSAKGGPLSASEKAKMAKIQSSQAGFRKNLQKLSAAAKKDPALKAGLQRLSQRSKEIEKAPVTLASYTSIIDLLATISGSLAGYYYYIEPSQRTYWTTISDSWSVYDAYYYETDYVYDWSYTETSFETYDSYDFSISSAEISEESQYIEETSFEMTEEESTEVAEESSEITKEESEESEMESVQEDVDETQAEESMDDGDASNEESQDEESMDDSGDESGDESGDDGGDDGGGGDE